MIDLSVSQSSGGHDPAFRKGVRRGVKARFQNVFDVGGFYVECESERTGDEPPTTENDISTSSGGCVVEVEEGREDEDTVHKLRTWTARRTAAAQAVTVIECIQKD